MRHINKSKPIAVEADGECTICVSHTPNKDGYIRIYAGKDSLPRMQFLHRMVWEGYYGAIPEGYEVDHMCRNRRCCNVAHLQLLEISEHKSKTNKERYKIRSEGIEFAIQEGFPLKQIAKAFDVCYHTVVRHKRLLNAIH